MKLKWDLEHVYFYLVSFVALILLIVGAVNLTRTAIAYVTPVYDHYNPYTNPETVREWEESFSPELVEKEKERFEEINQANYHAGLIRDLIGGFAYIIIALPVYLYHWLIIPKLEADDND